MSATHGCRQASGGWRFGFVVLLLCCACTTSAATLFGDPTFESVGTAEDIPDLNVTAVVEDHDGFLWIGTPNGLLRYDGYRFRRFGARASDEHSVGGVFIRALLVGSDGRLWIGTDADGLSVLDTSSGKFTHLRHRGADSGSLAHDGVTALAEDRDGSIWVAHLRGLDRLDPNDARFTHVLDDPGTAADGAVSRVLALHVDRSGDLWIGSWSGLHRRLAASGAVEPVFSDPRQHEPLAGRLVLSLLELADGRIAAGTARQGAFVIGEHGRSIAAVDLAGSTEVTDNDPTLLTLLQPRPNELWLGGYGGIVVVGVDDLRLRRVLHHDPSVGSSLAHAQVRTMTQDRAGAVWVGGYGGGLQRHNPNNDSIRVAHHSPARAASLSSASVSSVIELDNGEIWMGTRDNGIDIFDRNAGVTSGVRPGAAGKPGLSSAAVTSLAQGADRTVWAGTLAGLNHIDAGSHRILPLSGPPALANATIRKLLPGSAGDLWIGSNIGLAHWQPSTNQVEVVATTGGNIVSGDINALVQQADGTLWIGSGVGGLYALQPDSGQLQHLPIRSGDQQDARISVVGLLIDRDGVLWVDSAEGLFRRNIAANGTSVFEDISLRLGIAGQPFGANMQQDAQGRIWTQRFVLDPKAMTAYELIRADGVDIGTPWFRSYCRTHDGLLLFGGSQGLLVVDPEHFRPWSYAAPLRISDLRIDGASQAFNAGAGSLSLAPAVKSLGIEFAALDFSSPKRMRYRYRLEGYDPDWIAADADHRTASYGKLNPGSYVFRVRGENRAGIAVANEIEIPLRVLASFWQTLWFRIVLALAAAALTVAGYRLYAARIRRRAEDLERIVALRTGELAQAKSRAEAALIELQGTQRQLVAAEKMASLGGLVAGVAHEINTPLGVSVTAASHLDNELRAFENSAAANATQNSELRRISTTARQCADIILRNLERADRLVKSFKQVSVDQSNEQMRVIDLAAYLQDILLSLQPALKRTPHEVVIECPPDLAINTYPGAIYQVISNLVVNSLTHGFDATHAGVVTIAVSRLPGKTRDGREAIRIAYRDNGRGMPPEVLAHVFDPFFTTRRGQGGTGLGMHITFNRVTQILGGTIRCESAPGAGVLFDIEIPCLR